MPVETYTSSTDAPEGPLSPAVDNEMRLKIEEKADGTFRVRQQLRLGSHWLSKVAFSLATYGIATYWTVKWRDSEILREYATQNEANSLMEEFEAKARADRVAFAQVAPIPPIDRERFIQEKGLDAAGLKAWIPKGPTTL